MKGRVVTLALALGVLLVISAVLVTVAFGAAFCGVLELGLRRGRMLALSGGAAASAILITRGHILSLRLPVAVTEAVWVHVLLMPASTSDHRCHRLGRT